MTQPAQPDLQPGRAYRTHELRRFGANPTRLARRLVREGRLRQARQGLFYAPIPGRFGPAPPPDEELLRAFLESDDFVITGPQRWNALGLGSTSVFAATLVYNRKRTGELILDGRRFVLRRVYFPTDPPPEWFVVDLLQHHRLAGLSRAELEARLVATLQRGRWDRDRLRELAGRYGTKATGALVERCLHAAPEL